jgi:N-acetylneuraminic acid mutarotase
MRFASKRPLARSVAIAILTITGATLATEAPQSPTKWTGSLGERVAAQRAVEEVYWRHRIWPMESPGGKPALAAVLTIAQSQAEAIDGLRKLNVLASRFSRTIDAAEVQAEIDRIAGSTQMPDRLREIFDAVSGDADRFGDAIVRPQLADRVLRGYVTGRGETFDAWWKKTAPSIETVAPAPLAGLKLPAILSGCTVGTWKPMLEDYPSVRSDHVAVWTGSEMFIWGGTQERTGGLYNPATDSWRKTSTAGAPPSRLAGSGFWTGSEVLIAGGIDTGTPASYPRVVRYNPVTNAWTIGSALVGAAGRNSESVVFTGSDVIVWGGADFTSGSLLQTGYRYSPTSDAWTAISSTGAPAGRTSACAGWAAGRMVVWGGTDGTTPFNTGGRYNPTTDTWSPTTQTGAPSARSDATSASTGSKLIVWAGHDCSNFPCDEFDTGARYDPATDSWAAMSGAHAPSSRYLAPAVWTGSAMVTFGGWSDLSETGFAAGGGRYTEATNEWDLLPTAGAPEDRITHSLAWTGSEAIVWGGQNGSFTIDTGARYNVAADSWSPVKPSNRPIPTPGHKSVWTGSEMLIWGGNQTLGVGVGGRYDPVLDAWSPMATSNQPPGVRHDHTVVWTGTQMIVWGGRDSVDVTTYGDGGRYSVSSNSWSPIPATATLPERARHTAVWTGTRMLVWGGTDDPNLITPSAIRGASYDPATGSWTPITDVGALSPRSRHGAVWTGEEMIVFGGGGAAFPSDGARYRPATDSWTPPVNSDFRADYDAVWTGHAMIAHGGLTSPDDAVPGSILDARETFWRRVGSIGFPQPVSGQRAGEWLCNRMYSIGSTTVANAAYDPVSDRWTPVPKNPSGQSIPEKSDVVAAGSSLIVWNGNENGEVFCACAAPAVTLPRVFVYWGDPLDKDRVSWLVDPAADRYDLVRGDLATLRSSGGSFTTSTTACLANDTASLTLADAAPAPSTGFWYLVRGAIGTAIGSYDDGAASQSGSRDAEIAAAATTCP